MDKKYTAILGGNPSKGARSPILWNAVYKYMGSKIRMIPIDIKKKDIKKKFYHLTKDKNFLGGAVTMPYKETLAKLLGKNLSKEAKKIMSVNCIFRKKNNLFGVNTDGEASIKVFLSKFKSQKNKNILIIGLGGAGKAVSTYFCGKLLNKNKIYVSNRSANKKSFSKKIKARWIDYKNIEKKIQIFDIIINCTSVGFKSDKASPLNENLIKKVKKNSIIYDIIYQPKYTKLIRLAKKHNLKYYNGLEMNREQAVIAYKYVNKINISRDKVRQIMKKI